MKKPKIPPGLGPATAYGKRSSTSIRFSIRADSPICSRHAAPRMTSNGCVQRLRKKATCASRINRWRSLNLGRGKDAVCTRNPRTPRQAL